MLEIQTRSSKNRHDTTQENIKTTFIGLRLNMETYLYFYQVKTGYLQTR